MRIIYNNHFPFGDFQAINICGIIFAKRCYGDLPEYVQNHEYIHTMQMREMLYIFFYLCYLVEWLVKILIYRNPIIAYKNIGFEREAYENHYNPLYRHHRRHFAWLFYAFNAPKQ